MSDLIFMDFFFGLIGSFKLVNIGLGQLSICLSNINFLLCKNKSITISVTNLEFL